MCVCVFVRNNIFMCMSLVCVCMCVCMHVYSVCSHVNAHTISVQGASQKQHGGHSPKTQGIRLGYPRSKKGYIRIYVYVLVCVYVFMYVCMYMCVYMYIYI
jgi:hypothetical protein